ncbi:unnamed protein product [Merluccius merluccius]
MKSRAPAVRRAVKTESDPAFGERTTTVHEKRTQRGYFDDLELMGATQLPLPGLEGPTLVCLAEGFHPAGAALSWSEDGASVRGEEVQAGVAQRQPDGRYTLSSVLTLPSTRWRSGHIFTCHVSHSALSSPLSKSVSSQLCSL